MINILNLFLNYSTTPGIQISFYLAISTNNSRTTMQEDILEFIKRAIEAEKKDQEKYKRMAAEAKDPETRAVLEQLAKDEEEHAKVLKDRLAAIKLMQGMGML